VKYTDLVAEFRPKNLLMAIAWRDCLIWAAREPSIIESFTKDTGVKIIPAQNGLERMIDQATGRDREIARQFLTWFNANIWEGEPEV
jgi:hypothetical protein